MNRRRLLSPIAVVALWGVATALCAWAYASSFVHNPESVGYEADWGFQFLAFAVFRLPFLLLALGLLLWANGRYRI
jgi:Na+/pantothenate symporter